MATVLIVEDEIIIGLDMAQSMAGEGYEVSGPHPSEAKAMDALDAALPDFAFLDVNLGSSGNSLKVAERLRDHGVPFVFLTGYATSGDTVAARFPDVERIGKPCRPAKLTEVAKRLLNGG